MTRRTASAFTLIEIIVVTGILVTMILFLLTATATSQKLTRDSAERQAARSVAYAKLAELRATLRSSPIDGSDPTTKDDQFTKVLLLDTRNGTTVPSDYTGLTIGTTAYGAESVDIFNNEAGTLTKGYLYVATFVDDLTTPTKCDEDAANTEFGTRGIATTGTIDLDGDLTYNNTGVDIADLQVLPVLIRLEWKPGTWQPGDPVSYVEVGGLLY